LCFTLTYLPFINSNSKIALLSKILIGKVAIPAGLISSLYEELLCLNVYKCLLTCKFLDELKLAKISDVVKVLIVSSFVSILKISLIFFLPVK